jgi:RNA polymerase sigma-70 factor (ECF subfamily)
VSHDAHTRLSQYLPRLFGYAISLSRDDEQARDLVQECALRALKARSVPSDESAYRAWLFAILRNAAIDARRRQRNEPVPVGAEAEIGEVWGFDDGYIATVTVRQAMRRMSDDAREVIALVDIVGFSYAETAALLGVPAGTIMSRLSRARQALLGMIAQTSVRPLKARNRR